MQNETSYYDTLLLIINEKDGVVAEYQRQLYEASLIGISRVKYCFVFDSNSEVNRVRNIYEKLEKTCDILSMESLDTTISVWDSFLDDSQVLKTADKGMFLTSLKPFSDYRKNHMETLKDRKRIGKILKKD